MCRDKRMLGPLCGGASGSPTLWALSNIQRNWAHEVPICLPKTLRLMATGSPSPNAKVRAADRDRTLDFVSGTDKIAFDGSVFTRTATIDYVAGSAATSTNSTFLYQSGNGILSYDADGTGAGAAVAIATLGDGLTLNVGDFTFY